MTAHKWFSGDLKAEGIIEVKWIAGDENSADVSTKHLQGPLFEKHANEHTRATHSVMEEDHG